jgi:hypothetical protein
MEARFTQIPPRKNPAPALNCLRFGGTVAKKLCSHDLRQTSRFYGRGFSKWAPGGESRLPTTKKVQAYRRVSAQNSFHASYFTERSSLMTSGVI